jgi:hypothetical protein
MQAVYGDQCVDVSTVRRWVRQLKDGELGHAGLSDKTGSGSSKLFVPCILSTYEMKNQQMSLFQILFISTDLYMFRAYRPILRRIHIAAHITIGSVAVPFGPRALYNIQSTWPERYSH